MAASKEVADYVRHFSRPFIFSASMTPASTATALAALRVLRRRPELVERLGFLARYLREGLTEREVKLRQSHTPIVPLYTYEPMATLETAWALYDEGVYVNPVFPPATPPGECLLRTSLMASHTEEILDRAMDIIGGVFARMHIGQENIEKEGREMAMV